MPGNDSERVIRGLMVVNGGEDEYSFVVHAIDGGRIGEAVDSIEILVGDAVEGISDSDFNYAAAGPLETGDLQLIGFEPEEAKTSD